MGKIRDRINKTLNHTKVKASSAFNSGVDSFLKGTLAAKIIGFKIKAILIGVLVAFVLFAALWFEVSGSLTATASTSIFNTISSSGSTGLSNNYEKTGSLVNATNEDVANISSSYLESISKGDLNYAQKLLEGKVSILNTNNSGVYLQTSGTVDPIDLGEDFTLNEHILNTERYNFNRITWGNYIRGEKQSEAPTLTVDSETRLQYPADDEYDLDKFISMVRPYLQSWVIPMSMFSGVVTDTSTDNFANFAYQIISEGYHKINVDKHTMDTKTRVNNYAIYDKTTTEVRVIRECGIYKYNGQEVEFCYDMSRTAPPLVEEDIRENISSNDTIDTTHSYYVTAVETLDYSFKNSYTFEKYYEDTNEVYKEDTTKCDSYEQEEKEYNVKEEKVSKEYKVNPNPVPSGVDLSSLEFVKITSKTEFKWKDIIEKKGMEYTDTLTWTDRLTYDNSASSYQKGYTVEQLKSALGSDVTLTEQETNYYSALEKNEELNLIDILNAKESIYSTYTNNPHSKNTGFARSYLVTSYDVLKQNLSNLYADYGQSIYYGQSLVPDIVALRSNFYDYSTLAAGAFGWPVPGNKTVGHLFGYTAAYNGKNNKHGGIDLWPDKSLPKWNTEIVAAKAGKVTLALDRHMSNTVRVKGSHGNYIEITHDDGTKTLYGHLTTGTFRVKKGDTVEAGQVIGIMGSSGDSSGEHLHFEIWVNGEKVDPLIFYNVEAINGNSIYEIYDDARKYAEPRYSTPAGTYKYVSSKGTTEDEQDTSGTTSGGTNTPPRPAGSNVTVEVN